MNHLTTPRRCALVLSGFTLLALLGCQSPSNVSLRERGDWELQQKHYPEAIDAYKQSLDIMPGHAETYSQLAKAYLATGETGLARENALLAHSLKVEDQEIFAGACEALYADKKFEQLNRLLRARTVDRGKTQDFLLLGEYSERKGDVDEAQRAYLTAAQIDANTTYQPHLALAKLYKKVGDTRRYQERLSMAYAIAPNEPDVLEAMKGSGLIPGPTLGTRSASVPTSK